MTHFDIAFKLKRYWKLIIYERKTRNEKYSEKD